MRLNIRRFRPSPALVVAFIALFAAMSGFGYAAVKLKPNSIKTKNLKNLSVTSDKLADASVTTAKLAPDAVAPNAMKLAGVAPGGCHIGWLKGSLVINTANINPDETNVVPGFNCASRADDAVTIHREAVGQYTVTFAGNDAGTAVVSSAGSNSVAGATPLEPGSFLVKTWKNSDATFTDGTSFALVAY
jgi:hypothetical protein